MSSTNGELSGQLGHVHALGEELPNFCCNFGGYLLRIPRSVISFPALLNRVHLVLLGGSKPKMGRIDASSVVTSRAVVKDMESFWNGTVMHNPRGLVGANRFSAFSAFAADETVPIGTGASRPQPAGISLLDFGPKSLWKVFRQALRSKVLQGNLDHSSVLCAVGLQARRAFSFCHFTDGSQAFPLQSVHS